MTHQQIFDALYGDARHRMGEALQTINAMSDREYSDWVVYRNMRRK